jgi:hypothetical protein
MKDARKSTDDPLRSVISGKVPTLSRQKRNIQEFSTWRSHDTSNMFNQLTRFLFLAANRRRLQAAASESFNQRGCLLTFFPPSMKFLFKSSFSIQF